MTTGTGKIKVSDCASYTIIPSWARFALLLATLVIVGTCSTVSGYIGTPHTECSWRTDVANTSVLPQEGWIGTRTVTHIVPINVRLPHRYTYKQIKTTIWHINHCNIKYQYQYAISCSNFTSTVEFGRSTDHFYFWVCKQKTPQGHFSAFIYVVKNELRANATTVKPALGGHSWHLRWCLLNRGVC